MAFTKADLARAFNKQLGFERYATGDNRTTVEGLTIVEDNIKQLWERMGEAGLFKTRQIAKKVLEEAKNQVPYHEGNLFGTGKITKLRDTKTGRFKTTEEGSFIVSFGGMSETGQFVDYAMIIHENPMGWEFNQDYKKHRWPSKYPGPKKAEYLRDPAEAASRTMLGEVKEEVETEVQKFMKEVAVAKTQAAAVAPMRPRLVKKTT